MLPDPPIAQPAVAFISPEDAFRKIHKWWCDTHTQYIKQYEDRTYPAGFTDSLPWPGEDGWDDPTRPPAQARWLLIFINGALVPLGLNKIGRDLGFATFLSQHGWLEALTNVQQDPKSLTDALDQYLNDAISKADYAFQMRQLLAFYAVARNLESFLYCLHDAERDNDPSAFDQVFRPRTNPKQRGSGTDAPPLDGLLGMGKCQILRELYRVGRLKNEAGYRHAFTPIWKVRCLCERLFNTTSTGGAGASVLIFNELKRLGESMKLDYTFKKCFDLPFQFLAGSEVLQRGILGGAILDEADESNDPDYKEWENSQNQQQ